MLLLHSRLKINPSYLIRRRSQVLYRRIVVAFGKGNKWELVGTEHWRQLLLYSGDCRWRAGGRSRCRCDWEGMESSVAPPGEDCHSCPSIHLSRGSWASARESKPSSPQSLLPAPSGESQSFPRPTDSYHLSYMSYVYVSWMDTSPQGDKMLEPIGSSEGAGAEALLWAPSGFLSSSPL